MDFKALNVHMSMVFSFPNAPRDAESKLETGLGNALGQYLEFSGRLSISDAAGSCIHLNNHGALFVLATSDEEMLLFLEKHGNNVNDLLASLGTSFEIKDVPLLIQATRFKCGGITLGLESHHIVADGISASQFFLDWSSCTKNPAFQLPLIVHDRSSLMPLNHPPRPVFDHEEFKVHKPSWVPLDMATTLKVHFDTKELSKLKDECGDKYSTNTVLCAHFWRAITEVRELDPDAETCCDISVNGRQILQLTSTFFGNAVFFAVARTTVRSLLEMPLSYSASLLHESAKSSISKEYLLSAIDYCSRQATTSAPAPPAGPGFTVSCTPHVMTSNWTRLPFYDLEFGFGYPTSLATKGMNCEGGVVIASSSMKDGSLDVFCTVRKDHEAALKCLLRMWDYDYVRKPDDCHGGNVTATLKAKEVVGKASDEKA